MKKLSALLICAILIIHLLAGCGNTANPAETTPDTTTEATTEVILSDTTPAGTLMLSMGETYELVYNKDGQILELNGTSEKSKVIVTGLQHYVGRDCVYGARGILNFYISQHLLGDIRTMAVRVGFGDPLPRTDFLTVCVNDTQLLALEEDTKVKVIEIGSDRIDENGLLLPEAARELACPYINATPELLEGEDVPTDNLYSYSYGGIACTVDAVTGLVVGK